MDDTSRKGRGMYGDPVPELYNGLAAARLAGVTPSTICHWRDEGYLPVVAFLNGEGKHGPLYMAEHIKAAADKAAEMGRGPERGARSLEATSAVVIMYVAEHGTENDDGSYSLVETVEEIAKNTNRAYSSVNQAIGRMRSAGIIERFGTLDDGRRRGLKVDKRAIELAKDIADEVTRIDAEKAKEDEENEREASKYKDLWSALNEIGWRI